MACFLFVEGSLQGVSKAAKKAKTVKGKPTSVPFEKEKRSLSFKQPSLEENEASNAKKKKKPTHKDKRERIMKRLKDGDRIVYHWKEEGWLEGDFLRVCGGKDQEAPMVYKGKLLFQSYSDGEPFPDLDYLEIRQLVADGGKDEVSGWHFLSTLAAKTAA